MDKKILVQEELDFFIKGNISIEKSKRKKPFVWMPDQTWEDCIRLGDDFPNMFDSLISDIEGNEKGWFEVSGFRKMSTDLRILRGCNNLVKDFGWLIWFNFRRFQ